MPSLQRSGFGDPIRVKRKILLIALLVGFYHATTAQAAFAPKENFFFMEHPKIYARMQVQDHKQFYCLNKLWTQESHWNPKALNKSSGAFGIAQFMPTTWGNYHFEYKPKSAIKQINYGLHYISKRYDSICSAWSHEKRFGWY